MFNGLDELEDFADQLAPLTPEELAAAKRKQAAARTVTESVETEPVPDSTQSTQVKQIKPSDCRIIDEPALVFQGTKNS
jgi:hypothetical protein